VPHPKCPTDVGNLSMRALKESTGACGSHVEAALHTSVCDGILLPKTFEIDVPVDEGAGQRGSDWHSLSCQHVPTPVHSQGSTPKGPSLRLIAARRTIISGTLSDVGQRSGCAICSEFSTNGASRNQL